MHRAYSVLEIKSVDDEQRTIEGLASTPTPDRLGDIVEPAGAIFSLPLPLLWQHRSGEPIGQVLSATVTEAGISIRAKIAKNVLPRIDEAWALIKAGLVRGLSIGFAAKEYAFIADTDGIRFNKWEWLELSAVTIPANAEATITAIKSAVADSLIVRPSPNVRALAGAGARRVVVHSAGVPGRSIRDRTGVAMRTYTDRLKAFAAEKDAKIARQNELMGADDGATLDAASQEEFDTLQQDVDAIDGHMARLDRLEQTNKALAKAVSGATPEEGIATRGALALSPVVTVTPNRPPELGLVRVAIAKWIAFRHGVNPVDVAKARWPDDLGVHYFLKVAVPVGAATTTNATNAAPLAYMQDLPSAFMEWLRPQTIIGRMPGLVPAPFNVRVGGQTSGGAASWVGQAKPKPLTKFDFTQITLGVTKLASIAVISDELASLSNPSAEMIVRNSLAGAVVQKQDHDFIDPLMAEVANVQPASITNGVAPLTPTAGGTADAVRQDVANMMGAFLAANLDPSAGVWIMPNTIALNLALSVNALGQREFDGITMNGGTFAGLPVVASQTAALGGATGNVVILANAAEILLADDGQVAIDVNRDASLEMSDAPTQDGTAGTGAALVSLWQNNLIGIRAERHINWKKKKASAVVFMQTVTWTPFAAAAAAAAGARRSESPRE